MKKSVLIAVDASLQASQALGYAARLAAHIPELHYDLLHIQPAVSGYLLDEAERSLKARNELERLLQKNQRAGHALLEKYREQLVRLGLAPERFSTQTRPRHASVAEDILVLSQAAAYDAILVGRRGVTALQELFTGSVTANLVNHSSLTPIWIVDGDVGATSVLLAIDGSPGSLRALDHVAFMFGGECKGRIQMLHVQPRLQDYCAIDPGEAALPDAEAIIMDADRRCLDNFYGQARAILARCGIEEARFAMKTVSGGLLTAKAILDEVRAGGYGAVVMGKSGGSQSRLFGSVSARVLQKARNLAVWIVP